MSLFRLYPTPFWGQSGGSRLFIVKARSQACLIAFSAVALLPYSCRHPKSSIPNFIGPLQSITLSWCRASPGDDANQRCDLPAGRSDRVTQPRSVSCKIGQIEYGHQGEGKTTGNRQQAKGRRRKDKKTAKIVACNRDSCSQGEGQDPLYVLAEYSITGRRI